MKKCSLCESPLLARGWCRQHYLCWRRHGDPLFRVDRKATAPRGADLPQTKHGLWNHPLYPTWRGMVKRCINPKDAKFSRYGGRGITVCERWMDVANFVFDMSPKPPDSSIDRINNDGPYSPENCRWASAVQQARNRPQAKLTDHQRAEAIRLYDANPSPKTIAAELGIKPGDVKNVVYGHRNRAKQRP